MAFLRVCVNCGPGYSQGETADPSFKEWCLQIQGLGFMTAASVFGGLNFGFVLLEG